MAQSDEHARGFVAAVPEAFRYNDQPIDVDEVTGQILKMIPSGARVLDVGCGTGSISSLIIEHCSATVCGLEPHTARAEIAAGRGVQIMGEFLTPEIVPKLGTFDIVMFADVLEHMMDPYEALVLAKSLLGPQGSVIVSVPNVAHWTVRTKLLFGHFNYRSLGIMDATHLRWFTRKTICDLFVRAGYQVVKYQASSGLWMVEYQRFPLGLLPGSLRRTLLRPLVRVLPELFGCQHLVLAKVVT